MVSIHAPAREATSGRRSGRGACQCFNPRPRAGSDMPYQQRFVRGLLFQSTPPRGKRLVEIDITCRCGRVSIHAPAREATGQRGLRGDGQRVSIHAPAREATRHGGCDEQQQRRFNPRPRAGSDAIRPSPMRSRPAQFQSTPPRGKRHAGEAREHRADLVVSIHAPAREATPSTRPRSASVWRPKCAFQSTPPRGKRLRHRNSLRDSRKPMSLREHDSATSVADDLPSRESGSVALQRTERGVAACANRPAQT